MSETAKFFLPAPIAGRVDVLVVAGEHSGDEHAAKMVSDLRLRRPGLAVAALGGPKLQAAGAQLLHDLTSSSVVGLVEVLKNYPFFKALFNATLAWIEQYQPSAVCFVDYPGLNLRLAAAMRERGLSVKGGGKTKTLFYISPQIWAWKAGRRFTMARDLDAMAVIFPFEGKYYADTTLPVEFVGHPFLASDYASPVRYDPAGPVLLLPGSRKQAVSRIFPGLLAGFCAFGERDAVVLYPSEGVLRELEQVLRRDQAIDYDARGFAQVKSGPAAGRKIRLEKIGGPASAAAAVLTSSGTMSMHCALAAIPGAIAYRANWLTYLLGRWLVKIRYLGIANLLLDEPMYPEFIQGQATPAALAGELLAGLHDPSRRTTTAAQASRLRSLLAVPATGTAADWLERNYV